MEKQDQLHLDSHIDDVSKNNLFELGKWARIAGILMAVNAVLSLIGSFKAKSELPAYLRRAAENNKTSDIIGFVISVIMAILLIQFGSKTRMGLLNTNREQFLAGLRSLKTYMIIWFILMVLVAIILLIFFAMANSNSARVFD
jgi:uncharacterized membrane protein